MPKLVLGKVKQDNAGHLWPLGTSYVSSLQVPTRWHLHFLVCLNDHFLHFLLRGMRRQTTLQFRAGFVVIEVSHGN